MGIKPFTNWVALYTCVSTCTETIIWYKPLSLFYKGCKTVVSIKYLQLFY